MNKHKKRLNDLYILAAENDDSRFRLAAALYVRSNLLAYGLNEMKTHPFQAQFSKNEDAIWWHAENKAIFNAIKNAGLNARDVTPGHFVGASLYVARAKLSAQLKNDGHDVPGYAKPCDGCMKAIRFYGIRNIYFTNDYDEKHGFSYTHMILD